MSEYISREKLSEKLAEAYNKGYITWGGNEIFKEIIADTPAADVRENIHGEWIKDEKMSIVFDVYRCSRCSADGEPRYKFCLNCGADMRGDNNAQR